MDWHTLNRTQKVISIIIVLLLVASTVLFLTSDNNSDTLNLSQTEKANSITTPAKETFFVEITGQINKPGVYEVKPDYLVLELIERAGGTTTSADMEYIHKTLGLSKFLEPVTKIYIPHIDDKSPGDSVGSLEPGGNKISINNASKDELTSLPGIGPATADKIILARPYSELVELLEVSGIGEGIYNKIVTSLTL